MDLVKSITVPELLAPAGSLAHLKAAFHAGADAVYMGGQRFGARAYAENFTEDELVEGLHYAHFYNKRLYQTVNTLMKDAELDSLYEFLLPYYEAGLDGVIVQDMGTAAFIRKAFPDMEIHASTQMTITDVAGAMAAKRFGMTRVVPARELSFEEIRNIKEETGLEVEIFAHGALCYCYSGQCLLSSTYGGRSGNRGRCAQPCRLSYQLLEESGKKVTEKAHLLSPKDLCAYPLLKQMCEYGVDSLKIEGRMKNVEYVAGVTEIYRKELDRIARELEQGRDEKDAQEAKTIAYGDRLSYADRSEKRNGKAFGKDEADKFGKRNGKASGKKKNPDVRNSEPYHQLEDLYCREGFTDGYFNQHNGSDMMAVNYPKNLGRKIGKILDVKKYQITIALEGSLEAQDVLVIPTDSQNEVVLTVPAEGAGGKKITMRLPKGSHVERGMSVYRRRSESLISHINSEVVSAPLKLYVRCQAEFHLGKAARVHLSCEDQEVCLDGHIVESAQKRSLSKEDILKQFKKTGEVPFILEDCEITLDDGCFMPLSALKEIRQQSYALLQEKLESRYDRVCAPDRAGTADFTQSEQTELFKPQEEQNKLQKEQTELFKPHEERSGLQIEQNKLQEEKTELSKPQEEQTRLFPEQKAQVKLQPDQTEPQEESKAKPADSSHLVATVYDESQLQAALAQNFFDAYTFPAEFWGEAELRDVISRLRSSYPQVKVYYGMPRIYRSEKRTAAYRAEVESLCKSGIFDAIYTYNINESELVREVWGLDTPMVFAASLYEWNRESILIYDELYGEHICELPRELSVEEWKMLMEGCPDHQFEALVYGRYPLMLSAQCLKATALRCNHKPEMLCLKDQKGRSLPVTTCCKGCYNVIWKDNPWNLMEEAHSKGMAEEYMNDGSWKSAGAGHAGRVLRKRFDLFHIDKKQMISMIEEYRSWVKAQ